MSASRSLHPRYSSRRSINAFTAFVNRWFRRSAAARSAFDGPTSNLPNSASSLTVYHYFIARRAVPVAHRSGQGNEDRHVPLSPRSLEELRAYRRQYRARRKAGIEDVRLHALRHSLASQAVMSGIPVPVVLRMLGHSNVRMTLRYAHLGDREIEEAAEKVGQAIAAMMEI